MATKIAWTDETWNPTLGCTKVSAGCGMPRFNGDDTGGCYAIRQARIRESNPNPKIADAFAGLVERNSAGDLDWTGRVNLLPDRLTTPLHYRKRRKIFINSQSDLFHDAIPDEFIAKILAVVALAPNQIFQGLTKRHGRMRSLLNRREFQTAVYEAVDELATTPRLRKIAFQGTYHKTRWPLPNLWLGVSVEDQKTAELRIPALFDTPAAVRWISAEPLLGPVDLTPWLKHVQVPACDRCDPGRPLDWHSGHLWGRCTCDCHPERPPRIDWVVAGGESGPGARPMHPAWARSLRDLCQVANVPYLFKQWGSWAPAEIGGWYSRTVMLRPDGATYPPAQQRGTDDVYMYAPRTKDLRDLDGQIWDQFPAVAA